MYKKTVSKRQPRNYNKLSLYRTLYSSDLYTLKLLIVKNKSGRLSEHRFSMTSPIL